MRGVGPDISWRGFGCPVVCAAGDDQQGGDLHIDQKVQNRRLKRRRSVTKALGRLSRIPLLW